MTIEDKQANSMEDTLIASLKTSIRLSKMLIDQYPDHDNYNAWKNVLSALTNLVWDNV